MCSPFLHIVANLYMETFERKVITSAIASPRICFRYVDDISIIWPHGADQLDEVHLNRQHPQIRLTREMEADNQISFISEKKC